MDEYVDVYRKRYKTEAVTMESEQEFVRTLPKVTLPIGLNSKLPVPCFANLGSFDRPILGSGEARDFKFSILADYGDPKSENRT